jgi:hypothetical protein
MKPKQPAGPPMTLGNMRALGVQRLLISCLNPECLHSTVLDVSHYDADITVPSFTPRMRCSRCGGKRIDCRPNWKEQSSRPTMVRHE